MSLIDFILKDPLIIATAGIGASLLGLAALIASAWGLRLLIQRLRRSAQARRRATRRRMVMDGQTDLWQNNAANEQEEEEEPPPTTAIDVLTAKAQRQHLQAVSVPVASAAPSSSTPISTPIASSSASISPAPLVITPPTTAPPDAPSSASESAPNSDLQDILDSVFLDEDALHQRELLLRDTPRANAQELVVLAHKILEYLPKQSKES